MMSHFVYTSVSSMHIGIKFKFLKHIVDISLFVGVSRCVCMCVSAAGMESSKAMQSRLQQVQAELAELKSTKDVQRYRRLQADLKVGAAQPPLSQVSARLACDEPLAAHAPSSLIIMKAYLGHPILARGDTAYPFKLTPCLSCVSPLCHCCRRQTGSCTPCPRC